MTVKSLVETLSQITDQDSQVLIMQEIFMNNLNDDIKVSSYNVCDLVVIEDNQVTLDSTRKTRVFQTSQEQLSTF